MSDNGEDHRFRAWTSKSRTFNHEGVLYLITDDTEESDLRDQLTRERVLALVDASTPNQGEEIHVQGEEEVRGNQVGTEVSPKAEERRSPTSTSTTQDAVTTEQRTGQADEGNIQKRRKLNREAMRPSERIVGGGRQYPRRLTEEEIQEKEKWDAHLYVVSPLPSPRDMITPSPASQDDDDEEDTLRVNMDLESTDDTSEEEPEPATGNSTANEDEGCGTSNPSRRCSIDEEQENGTGDQTTIELPESDGEGNVNNTALTVDLTEEEETIEEEVGVLNVKKRGPMNQEDEVVVLSTARRELGELRGDVGVGSPQPPRQEPEFRGEAGDNRISVEERIWRERLRGSHLGQVLTNAAGTESHRPTPRPPRRNQSVGSRAASRLARPSAITPPPPPPMTLPAPPPPPRINLLRPPAPTSLEELFQQRSWEY